MSLMPKAIYYIELICENSLIYLQFKIKY